MDTIPRKKSIILAIEDNELIQKMYEFEFKPLVKEFITASDAKTALKAIKERGDDIDLILMDIGLPGKDGLTLASDLKKDKVKAPIVIVSSQQCSFKEKIVYTDLGVVDAFYVKPLTTIEIKCLVKRYSLLHQRKHSNASPKRV